MTLIYINVTIATALRWCDTAMMVGCWKKNLNVREGVMNYTHVPLPLQADQREREK